MIQHGIKESAGIWRQFIIEFLTLRQNVFRLSARLRITRTELKRRIRKAQRILPSNAFRLFPADFIRYRHKIFNNRLTEAPNIFFAIAISLHSIITEFRISVIPQLSFDLVTHMHKLIIQIIQFFLIILVPLSFRFPCCKTSVIVRIIFKRCHLRKCVNIPLKRNLR